MTVASRFLEKFSVAFPRSRLLVHESQYYKTGSKTCLRRWAFTIKEVISARKESKKWKNIENRFDRISSSQTKTGDSFSYRTTEVSLVSLVFRIAITSGFICCHFSGKREIANAQPIAQSSKNHFFSGFCWFWTLLFGFLKWRKSESRTYCIYAESHWKNQQKLFELIKVFCLKRGNFIHSFAWEFGSFVEWKLQNFSLLLVWTRFI